MPTGTKPPIPVGTAKVECLGTYGPTTWANVMYMAPGTWDPAHLNDVITLLKQAAYGLYGTVIGYGNFPTDWKVYTTKIAFRDASDSLYRATVADAQPGTGPATAEPAQVSYLINWTTNDPRRGGKPRQYIPGVLDADVADPGSLTSGTLTAYNGRLATWLAALPTNSVGTASGVALLEMSFVDAGAYRATAETWPVRGGNFSAVLATQRRRVDRLRF
jgi:hypothetical protein